MSSLAQVSQGLGDGPRGRISGELPMTTRTHPPETRRALQREVSAGGVVYRRDASGDFEVVLVRPAGRDSWVLPKGHLEPGESIAEAALREAREETGLEVSIARPLGEVA